MADRIHVTVVYSPAPRQVLEVALELAEGSSALQALRASGLPEKFPELDEAFCSIGIWGRRAALAQTLRDQDRVELYRPLKVDPKVARRERFRKQGARGTGLFARKKS